VLENPNTSRLFHAPDIERLIKVKRCRQVRTDFCQFGADWRKRTRLAMWHCKSIRAVRKLCVGKGGVCSITGKPHVRLLAQASDPGNLARTKTGTVLAMRVSELDTPGLKGCVFFNFAWRPICNLKLRGRARCKVVGF
jgi:hypothetical protein